MRTTIVIGEKDNSSSLAEKTRGRYFFFTKSEPEAHLFHIEHPEVDSYLIYSHNMSLSFIKSLVEHVHYLNSIITIIIIHDGNVQRSDFENKERLVFTKDAEDVYSMLATLPTNQRNSNRIEWPVKVKFWPENDDKNKTIGNVLSISSGGCFIRTNKQFDQSSHLIMLIRFKEFDFFTEGKVVRIARGDDYKPEGLAVQFLSTSPQTQKCIQSIINERLLNELMEKLNPDKNKGA